MTVPVLLYGSEIWGMPKFKCKALRNIESDEFCLERHLMDNDIENVHNKFYKIILGVNKYTTNASIHGETGSFPMFTYSLKSMMSFWFHILSAPKDSLLYAAYQTDLYLTNNDNNISWSASFKKILKYYGFEHMWNNQSTYNVHKSIFAFHKVVQNKFKLYWKFTISNDCKKLRTYCKFKDVFETEPYLKDSKLFKIRRLISKFRLSNHKLEVEIGRYSKPKTPLEHRICKKCYDNEIEDEFHHIMKCPKYDNKRKDLFVIYTSPDYNIDSFEDDILLDIFFEIMKCKSYDDTIRLYKYLSDDDDPTNSSLG